MSGPRGLSLVLSSALVLGACVTQGGALGPAGGHEADRAGQAPPGAAVSPATLQPAAAWSVAALDLLWLELGLDGPADRAWFWRDKDYVAGLSGLWSEGTMRADRFGTTSDGYGWDQAGPTRRLAYELHLLARKQDGLVRAVEARHPLYRLFDPDTTDQLNSLHIAIGVRQELLADWLSPAGLRDGGGYYPSGYQYRLFDLASLGIQGGLASTRIEPRPAFPAYDEAAVVAFLDSLPVPAYVYTGKDIFFINGSNAEYGAVHANGQILVFNRSDSLDDLIKLLSHELGHELGYLVFGRDGYQNSMPEVKAAYAGLYGRPVPRDAAVPWTERLTENFAEDFSLVYSGQPKWTAWEGVDSPRLAGFFAAALTAVDPEAVILIRDSLVLDGDGGRYRIFGPRDRRLSIVLLEPRLGISLPGFMSGVYELNLHLRNAFLGNLGRFDFEPGPRLNLVLAQSQAERELLAVQGFIEYEAELRLFHLTTVTAFHNPSLGRFRILLLAP